ncbi:Xaa-Pro peptidase family protein [Sphingomonas sp. IC081]|uniref:M24 family metallopeptidase n=1 Tax=Sphingomonas sp. IC081 TaxID=304378 RepID=UPI0011575F40|nr:Xaa-Pro peptidase family protein [Sphingomonas sp. IC081]QDK34989.1 peptidase [Sphingomonas sp. IC081]
MISKRGFLAGAMASAGMALAPRLQAAASPLPVLSAGADVKPISPEEHAARIARLQGLMRAAGVGAMIVESGSTLRYFTGIRWGRSERVTAVVIPAEGDAVVVTPAFEEPSVRETLRIPAEVRPWNEDEDPEARMIGVLRDSKVAGRKLAIEPTTRFFIVDALKRDGLDCEIVSGEGLIAQCRQIKSPAELALMQRANDITLAALRHVHGEVRAGMTQQDIADLMDKTSAALGGPPEFSLVLLNEASAYPHGSHKPQAVREGSVILMDCGAQVHGYQSDISRSWVFGEPTARQRKVWNTVRRGQEIALETARIGVPVGVLDDAVRSFYTREGWGPGYRLPGLSHRTGHGIGLDGHESAYLVHGDATPLQEGMCFSDEPGLYIPGEFGIRLEDCWYMTAGGPKLFTPLAKSLDQPI